MKLDYRRGSDGDDVGSVAVAAAPVVDDSVAVAVGYADGVVDDGDRLYRGRCFVHRGQTPPLPVRYAWL